MMFFFLYKIMNSFHLWVSNYMNRCQLGDTVLLFLEIPLVDNSVRCNFPELCKL